MRSPPSLRSPGLPPSAALLLGVFAAGVDNFVAVPMLLAIGDDLGHSLASVAAVVAGYTLAYGLMQLGWVYFSDRIGRVAVIRLGLAAAALATFGSAVAPGLALVIASRVVAGAAFAAVTPATITFIGDHVRVDRRARTLGDLVAAFAAGTAVGIVWGGLASDLWSWRWGFVGSAAIATSTLVVQLRYRSDEVADPRSLAVFAASVGRALRATWPRAVAILALLEGAVLFGFLAFFPAAIEDGGEDRRTAGLVVALYGVALVIGARPARRLAARWPNARTFLVGLLCGAAGLGVAAASRSVAAMAVAAILIAAAIALAHPLMQTWATIVSPRNRATTVGLFATSLFVGTALTTQIAAPIVTEIGFGWTFAIAGVLATAFAVVLAVSWLRYERAQPVELMEPSL